MTGWIIKCQDLRGGAVSVEVFLGTDKLGGLVFAPGQPAALWKALGLVLQREIAASAKQVIETTGGTWAGVSGDVAEEIGNNTAAVLLGLLGELAPELESAQ